MLNSVFLFLSNNYEHAGSFKIIRLYTINACEVIRLIKNVAKPRNPETPKPRNPETPKPRNPETPKPRNPETPKPKT